jgi:26S proteasome regulatory subunit N2
MMIHICAYIYEPSTGNSGPSEKVGELRQETVTGEREASTKPDTAEAMDVDQTLGTSTDKPTAAAVTDNPGPAASSTAESHDPEPEAEWVEHLRAVDIILSGEKTVALHQEFLIRNNHTDVQILKNTKVCKIDNHSRLKLLD